MRCRSRRYLRRFALAAVVVVCVLAADAVARAAAARVRVIGTRVVSTERAAAVLRANGFPAPTGIDALREAYLRAGYLSVAFDVQQAADSSYAVLVTEGEQARVGSVGIGGAVSRPEAEVIEALGLSPGSRFVPDELESRMRDLLAGYDQAGYPFAQVWVDSIGFDTEANQVNISLYLVEGNAREITGVVVEGLKKTRPELALRIAGVEPGVPYRAQILEDMYLRLVGSRVFDDVEFPTVRVASDGRGVDAVVKVSESPRSHAFVAALGYASSEGSQDRVLSGLAQLELNNIGGTLKDFGASWNNDGNGRSDTRIRYHDRLFLGRRLALGIQLQQTGQDTLYTWQSLGVEAERGFGRVAGTLTSASLGAFVDRNVFSTGSLLRSTRVRGRVGVSAQWGSERRAAYVRLGAAGSLASKDVAYREGSTGPGSVSQTIYEGTAEALAPAFWSLHYSLLGAVQTLESGEASLPLSEQFYIGGARTVRGYRENQFHGRRIGYARNELRLGRTAREGLYLFSDVGYVLQETMNEAGAVSEHGSGLAGFGFGVRSVSRLGRIDLSFAVSDEVSLQATKVHVLLEQNF
ncbi:MAG TPA: POTRA domain-containing protein [Candidatus Krumholzibacteria bacterium]|nr:POTRA domain-containing protein [Candidatus Krumholzibacteria bacterium]